MFFFVLFCFVLVVDPDQQQIQNVGVSIFRFERKKKEIVAYSPLVCKTVVFFALVRGNARSSKERSGALRACEARVPSALLASRISAFLPSRVSLESLKRKKRLYWSLTILCYRPGENCTDAVKNPPGFFFSICHLIYIYLCHTLR